VEELNKKITGLTRQIGEAERRLKLEEKQKRLKALRRQMERADFWKDAAKARRASKEEAELSKLVNPWLKLEADAKELSDIVALGDESLAEEAGRRLERLQERYGRLKKQLLFSAPHDEGGAVLGIQAGAGGKDAQDWAAMLERMYLRWAQKAGYKVKIAAESKGEEAGIKSATLLINGRYAYGKLKGEKGVHRLVRLSPFNAGGTRETSFAMVEVLPQIERPEEVKIDPKDLRIDSFRSSGHGGQSVNTTDSAVRITHLPTGVSVSIQNEKSQIKNKELAMKILRSRLAQLKLEQHQAELKRLKGPVKEAAWGNQVRNYVLHPYTLVKDLRSGYETADAQSVLDGNLDPLIEAGLDAK